MSEERPCVPEWCETGQEPHDDVCDNAPMPSMTKHEFVDYQESAAKHAIDAYRFIAEEYPDWSVEQLTDFALGDVQEASVCFAGIGSCGRGWCQHT